MLGRRVSRTEGLYSRKVSKITSVYGRRASRTRSEHAGVLVEQEACMAGGLVDVHDGRRSVHCNCSMEGGGKYCR